MALSMELPMEYLILTNLLNKHRNLITVASDISEEALKNTRKNLKNFKGVNYVRSNALDVNNWSKKIARNKKTIICFWFIIHEIFNQKNNLISKFIKKLKNKNYDLLICEINRVNEDVIRKNLDFTLMPEYYYFHDISDQRLFSKSDLTNILKKNNYTKVKSFYFDSFRKQKSKTPSIYTEIYSA